MDGIQENVSNNTCEESLGERKSILWIFLVTKLVVFLVCLLTCLLIYGIYWLLKRKKKIEEQKRKRKVEEVSSYGLALRGRMRQLKSGDTIPGKILITVTLMCNLAYLGLAVYRSFPPRMVNECISIGDPVIVVELLLTFELLLFALVRFLASDNIFLFWLNPYTLVDVWTLPHIFITIALGVDWLGLRYLRFAWLIHITAVLQFVNLVRSQNVVDLINLTIYFLDLWLVSSGILHLIESEGDFWKENGSGQPHTVLTYVYFTMVTMSTVGYGDFSPVSDLGRTFMIFFIIGGLAFFASILPTLVEVITGYYARSQYSHFDKSRVPKHVIVCGHITAVTAGDFLKDFLHPDRGDHQTHVLLLHPKRPDEDLRNVIRTYYTRVQFLHGSVLRGKYLHKAKIHNASAVFILTNKYTNDPKKEDHANLLRVVSVKNTASDTRCVIQILRSFSKHQALALQGWRIGHDIAVCIGELKLGLLAQSCLYPGFSTLIANMFYTVDVKKFISISENEEVPWKKNFGRGLSNELYAGTFSDFFKSKTFHEAVKICFDKLDLVLLALEDVEEHAFYVNPSPNSYPDLQLKPKTMWGYFVAQDQVQVSNVSAYCECCEGNKHQGALKLTRELQRQLRKMRWQGALRARSPSVENFLGIAALPNKTHLSIPLDEDAAAKYKMAAFDGSQATYDGHMSKNTEKISFAVVEDDTLVETDIDGAVKHDGDAVKPTVSNDEEQSEETPPLKASVNGIGKASPEDRSSSNEEDDPEDDSEDDGDDDKLSVDDQFLIHIDNPISFEEVVLNPSSNVLTTIHNQPSHDFKDHIILCLFADDKSPPLWLFNFLKPLRSKHIPRKNLKPVVIVCQKSYIEKEWPILSCIPKIYLVLGEPLRWANLRVARVSHCSVCVILTAYPTSAAGDEPAVDDKEAILCTLSIQKKMQKLKKKMLIITDLRHESNVQFLDFGDEDNPDERIYKAEPYACGRTFSVSMFDSVTSSAFHSPGLLNLLEALVNLSTNCRIRMMPIAGTGFVGKAYGDFYTTQLQVYGICLGLSRKYPSSETSRHFIITCPGKELELEETDIAFVLTDKK